MCDHDNITKKDEDSTSTTSAPATVNSKQEEERLREENEYGEYLKFRDQIIDSHCHVHEDVTHINQSIELPFKKIMLMGTTVKDWDKVNGLLEASRNSNGNQDKFIRCFGIHPWFVYQVHPPSELLGKPIVSSGDTQDSNSGSGGSGSGGSGELYKIDESWYNIMKDQLIKYPDALVGEIGIDKVTKVKAISKNDQESQMSVLSKQVSLANELNRHVSLHCVQLHGPLLKYFQDLPLDKFPPKIALHTFGGKPATVVQFTKMAGNKGERFYFGLSFINLTSSKVEKLIQAIPDDRLLLESDESTPLRAETSMFKVIQKISRSKSWTIQKTIEQTALNTLKFLSK